MLDIRTSSFLGFIRCVAALLACILSWMPPCDALWGCLLAEVEVDTDRHDADNDAADKIHQQNNKLGIDNMTSLQLFSKGVDRY